MPLDRVRAPFYKSLAPLLPWQELTRPADWKLLFGRRAPLELEIGTGNAEFLARESSLHPERDYVGIELRWASVKRALRNLAKTSARNVRLVMHDARPVLERLFAPRTLERVICLFPCPWRKERHARHRLLHPRFLRLVNSRLVDGGELLVVTDWEPFVEWTLAQLEGTGLRAQLRRVDARYETKYERKWRGLGHLAFHELRLKKEEHREVPTAEEIPVQPQHIARVDPARLSPQDEIDAAGALTITFKELVRDLERGLVMARVVVVEEPLTQHLWLVVARADDGSWWIQPARGCQMIPTRGVQRALDRLAEAARASVESR